MQEVLRVVCPNCEEGFTIPREEVELELSHEKMRKVLAVAKQMHNKFGIYYDRWVAAMEERGEPIRCRDCVSFMSHNPYPGDNICEFRSVRVNPGQFACELVATYRSG